MPWWGWLPTGIGIGVTLVGVPVAVYARGWAKAWDQTWGMR